MRGLIVSPNIFVTSPEGHTRTGGPFDRHCLRMWLLFWDELRFPERLFRDPILPHPIGQDAYYLYERGILKPDQQPQRGGEQTALMIEDRMAAFKKAEFAQPGSWALAAGEGSWQSSLGEQEGRALQVKLVQALPVPDQEVPLEDILNFREKRKDEREELMSSIDKVYLSILDAKDRPLAELSSIQDVARAARNQLDVTKEAGFIYRLWDMAADFNLVAAWAAVAAYGSIKFGADFSQIVGNTAIAGGTITVAKVAGVINPKKAPTPYRYVTSYHSQIFGPND